MSSLYDGSAGRRRSRSASRGGLPGRAEAESVAMAAFAFIAADDREVGRFLDVTGLDARDLRAAAERPEFAAAVLDHVLGNDALARRFAEHAQLTAEDLAAVAHVLTLHRED